jgi:hypothetical protein
LVVFDVAKSQYGHTNSREESKMWEYESKMWEYESKMWEYESNMGMWTFFKLSDYKTMKV